MRGKRKNRAGASPRFPHCGPWETGVFQVEFPRTPVKWRHFLLAQEKREGRQSAAPEGVVTRSVGSRNSLWRLMEVSCLTASPSMAPLSLLSQGKGATTRSLRRTFKDHSWGSNLKACQGRAGNAAWPVMRHGLHLPAGGLSCSINFQTA